ncbi:MAG TPA: DUF4157 domain-containing protein [Pyrinomonadaceae bacterium]|jgi:hypothetical protein|nr:DUF4157 domain-containing protein [Pyrinomonadaceae bacterium]
MKQARDTTTKSAAPLERKKQEEKQPEETSRLHPLLHIQRAAGNQTVLRLLESQSHFQTNPHDNRSRDAHFAPRVASIQLKGAMAHGKELHGSFFGIQRKSLEVSEPTDAAEKEADEVARRVVAGQPAPVGGTSRTINPKSSGSAETTPEFQSSLESSQGGGQSLDDSTRSEMESKMGADFSKVKIHTGREAQNLSDSINAKAFTHGQNIYFKAGHYNHESNNGKELLAHELAHCAQQSGSGPVSRSVLHRQALDRDDDYDVVKFGERGEVNLYRLSVAYGVPFAEVKRLNSHLEKDSWQVRKGDLIKLPLGTATKTQPANTEISETDISTPSDELQSEAVFETPIKISQPANTSKSTTTRQSAQAPTKTGEKRKTPATQTVPPISAASKLVAHDLLRKYASFLPGSDFYLPFSLDHEGLGKALAKGYAGQPAIVLALLNVTRWADRDDLAFEFVSHLSNAELVQSDRSTLIRLRLEMLDGIATDRELKEIFRIETVLGIKPATKTTADVKKDEKKDQVPFYKQGDDDWKDRVLGSVAKIGPKGCAVTAMSMAVSAISGKNIDPADMDIYLDEHSGYSGDNVYWEKAADAGGLNAKRHVGFDIEVVDQSLASGKPCVISVNGNGHWVAVTAKRIEKDLPIYTIHDPATGKAADMTLDGGSLVGAKGAFSKKSGKYIITLSK